MAAHPEITPNTGVSLDFNTNAVFRHDPKLDDPI
jgi:hypothetical protein